MDAIQQIIDIEVPESFLERSKNMFVDRSLLPLNDRFCKERSKDFYLGMIAAFRVSMSLIIQVKDEDVLEQLLTSLSINSTMIANEK